jgi:hypothetical protein
MRKKQLMISGEEKKQIQYETAKRKERISDRERQKMIRRKKKEIKKI